MSHAVNRGVRIHYEVVGRGPTLVLHHGLTSTLDDWHELGYVDALKESFELVLLDARGHGRSDKPHDPDAYAPALRVGDVTAVLDQLEIGHAHFLGYSYGGRVGLELALLHPGRVRSLVIGGAGPNGRAADDPNTTLRVLETGHDALIGLFEKSAPVSPAFRERLRAADLAALVALAGKPRDCLDDQVPRVVMPTLVYCGDLDGGHAKHRAFAGRLPNGLFASLPGLDHVQTFRRSDLVVPHVKRFLAEVA
jgi:pimeloyl-ACP methyl ester carboxylesterase